MSLPHMDVPRPPVPTSAIRSFLPVGAEIPVVFAFISDKGLSKAVPAIAPVVARKCLLDIWFVVLCMVMMFCMFLWSVFRFSMISYSAILEFFSNSSSEHCKYMEFWSIDKGRMNIFGEAINAFLSGVFRYSPGFSCYWPLFCCVSGCVRVVLQQIKNVRV